MKTFCVATCRLHKLGNPKGIRTIGRSGATTRPAIFQGKAGKKKQGKCLPPNEGLFREISKSQNSYFSYH